VLVVDDGSTDTTLAVAGTTASGDPHVRVIRAWPNRGEGFAVRIGMLAAKGDLVWNEVIRRTVELGGRLLSPTSEGEGTNDADMG